MFITQLTLVGYRGFRLRQIHTFIYRPQQKTQVILGTNGSGKSQTLKELSPLPAQSSDYIKGGYKKIEITHHGKQYVLSSLFEADGNRFIFECDGENLNPGFTVTVYKELVKQHFGYTQEIHAVLTGAVKFHTMSVNDRRAWFMNLSDVDYTYALKYYQRLKEKVRDLQGAHKLNQSRLMTETAKCLSEQAEAEIRQIVQELNATLGRLIDHRPPRLLNYADVDQATRRTEKDLVGALGRAQRLYEELRDSPFSDPTEALESRLQASQSHVYGNQREIAHRCEILDELQKQFDIANQTSQYSIQEVLDRIQSLEEMRGDLLRQIKTPLHFDEPILARAAWDSLKEGLAELYDLIAASEYRGCTLEAHQALQLQKVPAEQSMLKLKQREEQLLIQRTTMERQREKGQVTCPSCHTAFHIDYEEGRYRRLVAEHELACVQHEKAKQAHEQICVMLEGQQHFFQQVHRFRQLTRQFEALRPYWDYVRESDRLIQEPATLLRGMHAMQVDLDYHVRLAQLKLEVSEQLKLKTLLENSKQVDRQKLEESIQVQQAKLLTIQQETRQAEQLVVQLRTRLSVGKELHQLQQHIQVLMQSRDHQYRQLIQDRCVGVMDEIIRDLKLSVSQHERTLSQIEIQKSVVAHLSQQVTSLKQQLDIAKLALKALSPTEGLIAKGMTGFINHFVEHLNRFIEKIWLYPMTLQPVTLQDDDVDLDYRFEVYVNDQPNSEDVSKISAGMMEVIDLAFVAVSMKYLGLGQFPIFLDEFAVRMDHAHRQSAYRIIDYLIDSHDYSQVFLVSHYQDGYGNLSNAEILVLCDSNIQLPPHLTYNQHATLQ